MRNTHLFNYNDIEVDAIVSQEVLDYEGFEFVGITDSGLLEYEELDEQHLIWITLLLTPSSKRVVQIKLLNL